ncbi:transketolase [Nocardiopsis coralliicola]
MTAPPTALATPDAPPAQRHTSMRQAFLDTVAHAMESDPRIVLVLAEISRDRVGGAARRHPDRIVNLGIREQLQIGTAGGLALSGLRPVVHTIAPFLVERPFEQLKLDLGHQGAGAVLGGTGGSYDYAEQGRTHQSPGDVALLDTLPGWTVHVPGHPDEAAELTAAALPGDSRVYLRLSETANTRPRPVGGGITAVRTGSPRSLGTVLAVGPMLDRVLAATEGLDVTVAYTATPRPFDRAGLNRLVAGAGQADVLVVEPYLAGTSAHEVAAALADRRHRQRSLGVLRDTEVRRYGTVADHDRVHGLDTASIAGSARAFFLA